MSSLLAAQTACQPGQAASPRPQAQDGDLERQIAQLERDRQDAFVRNDVTALDQSTAEDYTTIGSSGRISTKPQMMTRLRSGTTTVLSNELDSLKARVYGNTAVLTGRLHEVSETAGQRKDERFLFTRVFVKVGDRWVAVAYQQTKAGG